MVLGDRELRMRVTQWQRFTLRTEKTPASADTPPPRLTIQGDRPSLSRLSNMRPEQLVTILAEGRPNAAEVFLLSLDACPP